MMQKPSYKELEDRIRKLENLVSSKHPSMDSLLLSNQHLLTDLIENSGTLIVIKDHDGRYLLVNRKWEHVTGLQRETVLGKTDAMLFSPKMALQFRENDLRVMESGSIIETEECLETPAGTRYYISSKFPLIDENGTVSGVYGVITDITELKSVEKALQQSQFKYQSLFDSAQVALFRTSMDGKLLEINNRYAAMAGYSNVEQCIAEFNPGNAWSDPSARSEMIKTLKENRSISDYEARITRKDGEVIWIIFSATLYPEQGYLEGSIVEITDRKRAELALHKNEAFHRKMVANIGDVIVIVDKDLINKYQSPNIEKMFGWRPEEAIGTRTLDNVHPEDLESVQKFFELLMGEPHGVHTLELRYKCKDGTYKWIEFTASNLMDDPDIQGLLANYHDITDRKQMDQVLRDSEARFRALHDATFGGVFIHDQGIILECNQGLSSISGYTYDELIGMDALNKLIAPDWRDTVMRNIKSNFDQPYNIEGIRKDGTIYPLYVHGSTIPYKGRSVRAVEYRDLSAFIKAEQEKTELASQLHQARKMESVGQLAGGVAHDFNNMLTAILGHAQIAMMSCSPSESVLTHLKGIQEAAFRSADLVKQLLTFARKQTVAPKVLDVNEMSTAILKMLRRVIGEDIDLSWLPGSDLWKIKMDPSQVDQLLVNLCINARDAITGNGNISIETKNISFDFASCANKRDFIPGDYVMLAVSDNGSGMSKDTQEHIFEPFFTTKEMGKGTGLGLATVYGVVKQNNGFINVYSELGRGTTFRIYLPRFIGKGITEPIGTVDEVPKGQGEVVLLVEDEAAIREVTQTLLSELGYVVLSAGTPGEAIKLAKTNKTKFQLLITDVIMPEMNGRELEKLIREIKPEVKCLFASGYTADIIAHHGVLDANVCFLPKPFSIDDLAFKVQEALGQKHH